MNQIDQTVNKDMSDPDLIDVETLDFSDDQTWLYKHPENFGENVDLIDWSVSLDWSMYEDEEYLQAEKKLYAELDEYLKNQVLAMPDKHKFDSRTYVKPKKQMKRPSIHNIVEGSNPPSITSNTFSPANKYLTYNKYSAPLGPILRLKTFNVDTNSENSTAVKEYAMKRRSVLQDDDPQLEDFADTTITLAGVERLSPEQPSKPINIDLSQPAHNLHNTFNKGFIIHDRSSLNMYQSGESLMRMSPPSLVSSLLMDSSGNFNSELDRRSMNSHRDSGVPLSGRDSIDPMMTSMTLSILDEKEMSILDEKDMSTSFLSQTTYPDHDSLMDSMPPSLVSSVNSSFIVSNTSKPRDSVDSNNLFSSATYTNLEQSQKLLSARPRYQNMFNSFTKRESLKNSESYTKSKEEPSQNDITKVLNENTDKKDSPKLSKPDMTETITLHYSNKFKRNVSAEKENLHSTFEKDDGFFKDMGLQRTVELQKNSLNVTLDKQELNEIIQARQKLSLARKALPSEPEKLPNQVDISPPRTSMDQTIIVPKKSTENASELLARRRVYANGCYRSEEVTREPPKRNATFKKASPKASSMEAMVNMNAEENRMIDINSATMNLIDPNEILQQENWGSQECAMVGSSESTDTGTLSSSSPPDCVPERVRSDPRAHVASTPLVALRKGAPELFNQSTISPIYDTHDDTFYTVNKTSSSEKNSTVINSATIVRKTCPKRDILAPKSLERKIMGPSESQRNVLSRISAVSSNPMASPPGLPIKSGLPTSKLRQYSSHKELRIHSAGPGASSAIPRIPANRTSMVRRGVYASNPALSPTAAAPPHSSDSYTIATHQPQKEESKPRPVLTNPPALIRQGTETLRRERPQSQLVQPKDYRAPSSGLAAPRNYQAPPQPPARPYSVAGASQLRAPRPNSVPTHKPQAQTEARPAWSAEARGSALRRPSRLPPPRRPPSVYSVAPASNVDHY